ncbi:MAG: helix-turn-helix domain-containing protein, partial [Chloroflexi bacterium]|nr:helix-turn-helix domain-containing protein [Chloroflexota bacterium]
VEWLEQREQVLTEGIYERLIQDVPEYRARASGDGGGARVRDSIAVLVRLYLHVTREGRRLTKDERAAIVAGLQARSEQGVSLDGLLHGLRAAMRAGWELTVAWATDLDATRGTLAELGEMSLQLLTFVDDITVALTEEERLESGRHLSQSEPSGSRFLESLLRGESTGRALLREAELVGWCPGDGHLLVALVAAHAGGRAGRALTLASADVSALGPNVHHARMRHELLRHEVLLVPVSTYRAEQHVLQELRGIVTEHSLVGVYVRGLSNPSDAQDAYSRLLEYVRLAAGLSGGSRLVAVSDLSVAALLNSAPLVERECFVAQTLGPLLELPRSQGRPLLETLGALLDHGGKIPVAAEALGVHPKTIQYRCARVAELTGLSMHVPTDRMRLDLAIHVMRLGTPATSLSPEIAGVFQ